MRIYTPLDLRNIKDVYVQSAFRRLDQWLRDLAGNLSASNEGSVASDVTIIQNILSAPPANKAISVDDCLRPIAGGTVNIQPSIDGEMNWRNTLTTAPNGVTFDTTQFPNATGVWKFQPGGNMGEAVYLYSAASTVAAQNFGARPKEPFELHMGTAIAASPQRNHSRFGIGYYPSGAAYPDYFVGFVYWYVDQQYTAVHSYSSLTLLNDPGGSARQDMFMCEVVSANAATAYFIGPASGRNALDDLSFIIDEGVVKFYVNGVQVGPPISDIPKQTAHGNYMGTVRATGTSNPGSSIRTWLDYFRIIA